MSLKSSLDIKLRWSIL